MTDDRGGPSVNAVAALFQTLTTVAIPTGTGLVRILKADPRRTYVEFSGFGGFTTNPKVYPGPPPDGIIATQAAAFGQQYKFRDCPSVVVGEWFAFNDGTTAFIITEQLFIGG